VVAKRLSVRETEKLVLRAGESESQAAGRKPAEKSRDVQRLEEELSDALATQVSIKLGAKNRGQLVIDFADLDALEGVIAKLRAA
jgi:ParB family chromosome partitioning protein